MRYRRLLLLPGLVGALVLVSVSEAGTESGEGSAMAEKAYSRMVDGRTEPEKIPEWVRYGAFVTRYPIDIRNQLIQDLPPQDDAILSALVADDEQKTYAETRQYEQALQKLCQVRTVRDPVALARENQRIVDEFYASRVRRYEAALAALSPAGRAIVDAFIETAIVPNSQTAWLDMVEWAGQEPEEYLHGLEIDCHVAETGQLPVWLQEELERRMEQDSPDARESIDDNTAGGVE